MKIYFAKSREVTRDHSERHLWVMCKSQLVFRCNYVSIFIVLEIKSEIMVENRNFFHTPPAFDAHVRGEFVSEYCHMVLYGKPHSVEWDIYLTAKMSDRFSQFYTILACDRRMDGWRQTGRTSWDSIVRAMHMHCAVKKLQQTREKIFFKFTRVTKTGGMRINCTRPIVSVMSIADFICRKNYQHMESLPLTISYTSLAAFRQSDQICWFLQILKMYLACHTAMSEVDQLICTCTLLYNRYDY